MKQRHKQIRPDGVCVSDVPALRFICSSNLYAGQEMDVRDLQFLQTELSTLQLTKVIVRFGLMSGANFDRTKA